MVKIIIWTVAVVTVLGIVLALVLYLVAKRFRVEEDPRIDEVEKAMPGANCGGCGFAGCRAFAEAAVKAPNLDNNFCPVGGNETMAKVAAILGYEVKAKAPLVAVVRCNGTCEARPLLNRYDGFPSCNIKSTLYTGDTGCAFGCLGCGDCAAACQFGALSMDPVTGLPVVDQEKCTACGACVKACPKRIIELRPMGPRGMRMFVSCINQDKGPVAKKACANACIGCGICVKTCTHDAIVMQNNIAYIDPAKCKLCRECEAMCPTGAIHGVNFPKPLDKDAIKERIKIRQQKAKEAAAVATTPSVAEKKVDAPSGVSPSAPAPVVANKKVDAPAAAPASTAPVKAADTPAVANKKVDAPAGVPAANTKEGPKDE